MVDIVTIAVHLELAGTAEEVLVTVQLFPLLQGRTVRDVVVQRRTSRSSKMETGFAARLRATRTQHTTLLNALSETFRVPTLPPLEDYVCMYGGNPFRSSNLRGTSPHGSAPSGSRVYSL